MKCDSGSHAAFAEQGSSASKTTAAKVMDVIARLPGCPANAVSACTHVKNGGLVDEGSPSEPRGNPAPKDQDTSSSSHRITNGAASKSGTRFG